MALYRTLGRSAHLRAPIRKFQRPERSFRRLSSTSNNEFLRVHDEVRDALNSGKPVVALETTIYTHGFPYPDNVALASHLESVVRVNGGVPATIGILDGIAHVGMDAEELIRLASSAGKESTLKLSRRDLGFICGMRLAGKKFNGGTTIAGTMILAELAGIQVFATGGLGGVHRGAESSMDISADLTELGRTPVAVVSSGCKSFLDIPRTLEYLETEGVGVSTFADGRPGKVDFPAFWSRDSGVKSPTVVQDEIEAAAIICEHKFMPMFTIWNDELTFTDAQNSLSIKSGLLFANPIPEEHSIPKPEMDLIIAEAIKEATAAGASGKDNTPFILSKIKELSGSKSIAANRALIESNVRRGTIVARELALMESKVRRAETGSTSIYVSSTAPRSSSLPTASSLSTSPAHLSTIDSAVKNQNSSPEVVVAGALAVDFSCNYSPFKGAPHELALSPQLHTSNPSRITQTLGGVGHNIAKALHYLGANVSLYSAVGDDLSGRAALAQLNLESLRTDGIKTLPDPSTHRTAQYVAVNDANKDLMLAMADMSILESISGDQTRTLWPESLYAGTSKPKCLVVDGNWSQQAAHTWLRAGKAANAITAFEPVSTAKASRFIASSASNTSESTSLPVFPNHIADITTPNQHELAALHSTAQQSGLLDTADWWCVIDALGIPSSGLRVALAVTTSSSLVDEGIPQRSIQLLPFIPTILTKLGPKGVLLTTLLPAGDERLHDPVAAQYVLSRSNIEGSGVGGVYVRLFEPPEVLEAKDVVSVNGVGDTFLGAVVAGLLKGRKIEQSIEVAQRAAGLSLRSKEAVSPELATLREFV